MIIQKYLEKIIDILNNIRRTQSEKINLVSTLVADVIKNNGIVYIFGCGHSHLIALDCFYRAGGLANVSAMLDTDLMLHNGAAKSSKMEKISGIAEEIFKRYCITEKDLIIVVSTSGKNAVPIEMAITAKKNGIKVVSVVSSAYFEDKNEELMYVCLDLMMELKKKKAVLNISKR